MSIPDLAVSDPDMRPLSEDEKSFEGIHEKLDIVILQLRTLSGRVVGLERKHGETVPRLDSLDRGMFETISLLKSVGGEVRAGISDAAEAKRIALSVRDAPMRASWTDEVVQSMVKKQVSVTAAETDLDVKERRDKAISRTKIRANVVRLCYILGTILLAALARYLR